MKCLQTLVEIKIKGEGTVKQEHCPPSSSTRIKSASSAFPDLQGEDPEEALCTRGRPALRLSEIFRRNFV